MEKNLKPELLDPSKLMDPTTLSETLFSSSLFLKDFIFRQLEELKAEDIVVIDLRNQSSLADFMIVASGKSNRHVSSIAENVSKTLKDDGYRSTKIEGMPQCDWVLLDCYSVIVHVFRPEIREFYNLEKMWSELKNKDQESLLNSESIE